MGSVCGDSSCRDIHTNLVSSVGLQPQRFTGDHWFNTDLKKIETKDKFGIDTPEQNHQSAQAYMRQIHGKMHELLHSQPENWVYEETWELLCYHSIYTMQLIKDHSSYP